MADTVLSVSKAEIYQGRNYLCNLGKEKIERQNTNNFLKVKKNL